MQHPIDDTTQLGKMQNPANDAPKVISILQTDITNKVDKL